MQAKLEHLVNGTWRDVTSRLHGMIPQQLVRGVAGGGGALIGTGAFLLDNSDGALTPRHPSSPWYPYLTRFRPVRYSVLIGGVWRQRHYGYLDSEPLSFIDEQGIDCRVTWSTVDHFGLAAMRSLRSVAVESIAARNPLAYWPLTDAETTSLTDQSRYPRPGLARQQVGTTGDVGFGGGATLPTDNTGGLTLTPTSDSNGVYFQTDQGIDLPASWAISVHITPATKDGYVCQIGTDAYSLGVWWDTSAKKLSAIETLLDSGGDPVDYVLSTTSATFAGGIETMTVTPTGVKLGSSSTTGTRRDQSRMLGSQVSVGSAFAVESGRQRLFSGEVKHLAIWSGTYPAAATAETLTGPTSMLTLSTAVAQVLAWAGLTVTVTTSGTDRPVVLVKTEGMTATDLISNYARGSLARIYCAGDGTVRIAAFDGTPTSVTAPSGDIDPSIEWAANPDGDVTDATMTWPDGSVYSATEEAAYRSQADLPGVLASASGRSVTDWTVSASDGAPAFRQAVYDLLTMPGSDALALTEPTDRLTVPGLPAQIPTSSQTAVVQQITETLGVQDWTLDLVLDSDSRDRMFIVGDAVRGVVGGGYLAAPLGPGLAGSVELWQAGDRVDAANLNGRQFGGGQMQCGQASITPTADVDTSVFVPFPVAFTAVPKVCVMAGTGSPWTDVKGVTVSGITATGFTLWMRRLTATGTGVNWVAAI